MKEKYYGFDIGHYEREMQTVFKSISIKIPDNYLSFYYK